MKRYILTGPPGAGKTAILRALERRGMAVVEEAATDVIALGQASGQPEPWTSPRFVDDIVALQRTRQERADRLAAKAVVFDRSPTCTLALARHLGFPPSQALRDELERIERHDLYERRAFFVEGLGFMVNTEARRIGLKEAEAFGRLHRETYLERGYDLVGIPPGPVQERAEAISALIAGTDQFRWDSPRG